MPCGLRADNVAKPMPWQAYLAWRAAVAMPSSAPPLPPGVTVEEHQDAEGNTIGRSCHLAPDKAPCFLQLRGTLRLAESLTSRERKGGNKFVLTDFCALREVRSINCSIYAFNIASHYFHQHTDALRVTRRSTDQVCEAGRRVLIELAVGHASPGSYVNVATEGGK